MIVTFNFNLEAWVKHLEIEADSEEAAREKLMSMTLADMINEDAVVDTELTITEIEHKVFEYDTVVKVTDIEYDFDGEDFDAFAIEQITAALPKEMTLNIHGVRADDDLEELISDEILGETDYYVKSFKFQTLETK